MSNRLELRALLCAAIALPTVVSAQTPIDRRVQVEPDGIVEISNVAGSVEVVAGGDRELVIRGTLAEVQEEGLLSARLSAAVMRELSAANAYLETRDTLARAYGWTEREILALSPSRRHYYVGLVTG